MRRGRRLGGTKRSGDITYYMAMRWKRGQARVGDATDTRTRNAQKAYNGTDTRDRTGEGSDMRDHGSSDVTSDGRGQTDSVQGHEDYVHENGGETADAGHVAVFSRFARTCSGAFASVKSYFGSHSPRFFAGLCCCVLGVVVLLLPSAYVVEAPGPTHDVLGTSGGDPVISIGGGHAVHKDSGKLLLVTVNASGTPEYPVTNAEALVSWMSPHRTVTPSEAVFSVGQSSRQYAVQSQQEMKGSQQSAAKAALTYAKSLDIDTRGVTVSMHIDDIGGPSAGMMYALGVLDKLTARDETGGAVIAGTGTIDARGEVGKIGGIRLKMLGARRDGATWFLAPQSNCAEVVGHVPQGLRDVKVATLNEAYRAMLAIGQGKGNSLPHCAAQAG